jgi:uncharacterized membrane protein
MEEKTFFDTGNVRVTNARFIVDGQTYAMNGVTSVKQAARHPSRVGPTLWALIGLLLVVTGAAVVLGLILLVVALLWGFGQKPVWIVVLSSSSGEAQALTSQDRDYIDGVISALNESIVHRG